MYGALETRENILWKTIARKYIGLIFCPLLYHHPSLIQVLIAGGIHNQVLLIK